MGPPDRLSDLAAAATSGGSSSEDDDGSADRRPPHSAIAAAAASAGAARSRASQPHLLPVGPIHPSAQTGDPPVPSLTAQLRSLIQGRAEPADKLTERSFWTRLAHSTDVGGDDGTACSSSGQSSAPLPPAELLRAAGADARVGVFERGFAACELQQQPGSSVRLDCGSRPQQASSRNTLTVLAPPARQQFESFVFEYFPPTAPFRATGRFGRCVSPRQQMHSSLRGGPLSFSTCSTPPGAPLTPSSTSPAQRSAERRVRRIRVGRTEKTVSQIYG